MKSIYQAFLNSKGVETDTRKLKKGKLFIALKGQHFDANELVEEALNKGAYKVITSNNLFKNHPQCIVVNDTFRTLQELAAYHRQHFSIPIVGITGSNGKTTTKELISHVLSAKMNCLYTPLNLNNHIGVPLTLLQLNSSHEVAVIEMGANHPGEIQELCEIVSPTHGIITNIGKAHLEGFGNLETLINTKKALYDAIKKNDGVVFVNGDDPLLMNLSERIQRVIYSSEQFKITVENNFPLTFSWFYQEKKYTVKSQLFGNYNLPNFLAAIAVGLYFQIDPELISEKLSAYKSDIMRSQIVRTFFNEIILDAYNANPTSMKKALEDFLLLPAKNKTVILGEMLELGTQARKEHEQILQFLSTQSLKQVFLIGQAFYEFKKQYPAFHFFQNTTEMTKYLQSNPLKHQLIFIKGSRGNKLEQLIPWV